MPVQLRAAFEFDAAVGTLLDFSLFHTLLKTFLAADLAVGRSCQVIILCVADFTYLETKNNQNKIIILSLLHGEFVTAPKRVFYARHNKVIVQS